MSFLKDLKDLKKDISVAVNEKETKTEVPVSDMSSEKKGTKEKKYKKKRS